MFVKYYNLLLNKNFVGEVLGDFKCWLTLIICLVINLSEKALHSVNLVIQLYWVNVIQL